MQLNPVEYPAAPGPSLELEKGRPSDALSGVADGYTSKLLAGRPSKGIGAHSRPLLLNAAGLKLQVVVDEEQLAKVRPRLKPKTH